MVSSVAEELRDRALELLVDVLRAADEAHGRQCRSRQSIERLVGGRDHLRVRREPEVVVGAEVEHLAAAHPDRGRLRRSR